jgi:hypothetical protein
MSVPVQAANDHAAPTGQPSQSDQASLLPNQLPQTAEQPQEAQMNDQHGAASAGNDTVAAAAQRSVTAPATAAAAAADGGVAGHTAPSNGRLVQEGDTVILEVNRERYSFVHIKRGGCGCRALPMCCVTVCAAADLLVRHVTRLARHLVMRVMSWAQEGAGRQEGLLG